MICDKIKERRLELGLTQLQLSELTGIKKNTISNYENNVSSPSEENIFKIMEALKCDANYLFEWFENEDLILSSDEKTFVNKYRKLDDYGREAVGNILDVEYRRCTDVQYAYRVARSFNDISKPKVVEVDESKFINAPENDIDM
ncbi:MAG: helix-turn-helix transcriptional regulator [Acutalibacteraceae bacterium]|nr:helix-turn-helix transcriptional regulator [Acutalibacteraceae bacterium]